MLKIKSTTESTEELEKQKASTRKGFYREGRKGKIFTAEYAESAEKK